MSEYRICARCIMDTSDPDIRFDEGGVCNHCREYDERVHEEIAGGEEGMRKLREIAARIRADGEGKEYDCVIGVSGGVDSSYAVYVAKNLGLRLLAVHMDNGWDSELSVMNIQNLLDKLGIDLRTHVLSWEEFKDIQLAFLRASTPDSEIPTDHAIAAVLQQTAKSIGVRYIITGLNCRTESHLPAAWSQGHSDWKYIRSVHERFGTSPAPSFPHTPFLKARWYSWTLKWVPVLNYIDYRKADAMKVLEEELSWRYYGGKHYESIYTRFYQGYILPVKYGFDKRRTHLSSLICSGEMSREEALRELEKETYPRELQSEDLEYVIKKLGLSEAEFEDIMKSPKRSYWDYPSWGKTLRLPIVRDLATIYQRARRRSL